MSLNRDQNASVIEPFIIDQATPSEAIATITGTRREVKLLKGVTIRQVRAIPPNVLVVTLPAIEGVSDQGDSIAELIQNLPRTVRSINFTGHVSKEMVSALLATIVSVRITPDISAEIANALPNTVKLVKFDSNISPDVARALPASVIFVQIDSNVSVEAVKALPNTVIEVIFGGNISADVARALPASVIFVQIDSNVSVEAVKALPNTVKLVKFDSNISAEDRRRLEFVWVTRRAPRIPSFLPAGVGLTRGPVMPRVAATPSFTFPATAPVAPVRKQPRQDDTADLNIPSKRPRLENSQQDAAAPAAAPSQVPSIAVATPARSSSNESSEARMQAVESRFFRMQTTQDDMLARLANLEHENQALRQELAELRASKNPTI